MRVIKSSARKLVNDLPEGKFIVLTSKYDKVLITKNKKNKISIQYCESNNCSEPIIGNLSFLYKSIDFKKHWFIDITEEEKISFEKKYDKLIDSKNIARKNAIELLKNCYNLYDTFYSIYLSEAEKLVNLKDERYKDISRALLSNFKDGNFGSTLKKCYESLNIKIVQPFEDKYEFIFYLNKDLGLKIDFMGYDGKFEDKHEYRSKHFIQESMFTPDMFGKKIVTKENLKTDFVNSRNCTILMNFIQKRNNRIVGRKCYTRLFTPRRPIYENWHNFININVRIIEVLQDWYNININDSEILLKTLKTDAIIYNSEKDINWDKIPYHVNYLWKNIDDGDIIAGQKSLIEGNIYSGYKFNTMYGHYTFDIRRECNFDVKNWPNNLEIRRPLKFQVDVNKKKEEEYVEKYGRKCYRCNSTNCKPNIFNGVFDMLLCPTCSTNYFYEMHDIDEDDEGRFKF